MKVNVLTALLVLLLGLIQVEFLAAQEVEATQGRRGEDHREDAGVSRRNRIHRPHREGYRLYRDSRSCCRGRYAAHVEFFTRRNVICRSASAGTWKEATR